MKLREFEIGTQTNCCEKASPKWDSCGELVGNSRPMQNVYEMIRKCADVSIAVLIMGETGTGKELVARAIHHLSRRRNKPFVAVNCGALPENLVESELFGHERGAFSGATQRKTGRFEAAADGTIFLDEIGELPLHLQAKLLRVLQEKEVERIGGLSKVPIAARFIAATNKNLKKEMMAGRFREDLYYRLNVFPITVPPLRHRKSDIPVLAAHFIEKYGALNGQKRLNVSPEAITQLMRYSFPGNVRELENLIARTMILAENDYSILYIEADTFSTMSALVVKEPRPHYLDSEPFLLDRERLLAALRKIHLSNGPWHKGLRCISINDLVDILMEIGPNPFSRSSFARLLRSHSKTDSSKYKTAGEYLKLLTANHICRHNGQHANKSRYWLNDIFLISRQMFKN